MSAGEFSHRIRVYIEDTDAGGIVYYVNYLRFMERARTEMMRSFGFGKDYIFNHDLMFVVRDVAVHYRGPARLDDELDVTCELAWVKGVRQGFRQRMTRKSDGELVATAELSAAMLHADSHKPARVPAWIRKVLET